MREEQLSRVFRLAAVYNIAWGTAVSIYPNLFFRIFDLPPINYPFVMSGLGMCIGLCVCQGVWPKLQRVMPRRRLVDFNPDRALTALPTRR